MAHTQKHALVVRGGWSGHLPVEATALFVPFLKDNGYEVAEHDDLDVYADATAMARADLILQCWTMGTITQEQLHGLRSAVAAGAGFGGWHGGIVDSFRASSDYLHITGAQFAAHPRDTHQYTVHVVPEQREHPIVRGLPQTITVEDEQYWMLSDPRNEVLATTTIPVRDGDPWASPVTVPAIWTRGWGAGRIFVCTPGHHLATLERPEIRTVIERGLLWASR